MALRVRRCILARLLDNPLLAVAAQTVGTPRQD